LSEDAAPGPIRLALVIEDPALADRLAALLTGVPGLWLGATEAADAAVVPSSVVPPPADDDVPLTPRELEVLALLVLAKLGVAGMAADVEKARSWYRMAESQGSAEATRRLHALVNH
jgi:hypothetical protein